MTEARKPNATERALAELIGLIEGTLTYRRSDGVLEIGLREGFIINKEVDPVLERAKRALRAMKRQRVTGLIKVPRGWTVRWTS